MNKAEVTLRNIGTILIRVQKMHNQIVNTFGFQDVRRYIRKETTKQS